MYLFIDDERFPANDGNDWNIARTLKEVKDFVRENGIPKFISFDHDLGDKEPTGYDIAKWLVDQDMNGADYFPDDFGFYVHSQNPIGKRNIESYLKSYLKFVEKK